jgi:X-X-X-Leu-X-X-Gly heptad repeat protein
MMPPRRGCSCAKAASGATTLAAKAAEVSSKARRFISIAVTLSSNFLK